MRERPTNCYPFPCTCLLASCLKSSILLSMDRANIVIIGGGVVGCAVARAVSRRWSDVFLVEQMPKLGMGASTRNSGVIHSGIYYPPGSLKAQLCVAGNRMLYEFCAAHNVPHRNCGKLVVAHSSAAGNCSRASGRKRTRKRRRRPATCGPRRRARKRAAHRSDCRTGSAFDRNRLGGRSREDARAHRHRTGSNIYCLARASCGSIRLQISSP